MRFWKIVLAFFCSLSLLFALFVIFAFFSLGTDTEELGSGYQFINEDSKYIADKNHSEQIPSRIIELGWDDRFIVAVQIPDIAYIDKAEVYKYPQIHDHRFYWIIDKDNDKVYGPLLYDSYEQKKDSLMKNHRIWLNFR